MRDAILVEQVDDELNMFQRGCFFDEAEAEKLKQALEAKGEDAYYNYVVIYDSYEEWLADR